MIFTNVGNIGGEYFGYSKVTSSGLTRQGFSKQVLAQKAPMLGYELHLICKKSQKMHCASFKVSFVVSHPNLCWFD